MTKKVMAFVEKGFEQEFTEALGDQVDNVKIVALPTENFNEYLEIIGKWEDNNES